MASLELTEKVTEVGEEGCGKASKGLGLLWKAWNRTRMDRRCSEDSQLCSGSKGGGNVWVCVTNGPRVLVASEGFCSMGSSAHEDEWS